MSDSDFWKNRYEPHWGVSSTKEDKVKLMIEQECNCTCKDTGLGTGQTTFLSGTAKSRGFEKGGSDLHIDKTNICVEVTGPNVDYIGKDADLWLRPDKIEYAIKHPENDVWVVHVLQKEFYPRAIHINEDFKKDYHFMRFKIVHPSIRGTKETYAAIPANSSHVVDFNQLCTAIKTALNK